MAKKKVELTLEELQAKKSKTQRGWVRACAIILAVALTGGIYGIGAKGGPRVEKRYPSVVQVNNQVAAPKDEPKQDAPAASAPQPAPSTEEEGGGLLDTLMGLIGGIDFGSLIQKLNPGQLGVTVANKIDQVKDTLIDKVNQLQASIQKKPVITHEAVETAFAADAEIGSAEDRQQVVTELNAAMKNVVDKKAGYKITRNNHFNTVPVQGENKVYYVNIGPKTADINKALALAGQAAKKPDLSIDSVILEFTGGTPFDDSGESREREFVIPFGKTATEAAAGTVDQAREDANYLKNVAIKASELTADDICILDDESSLETGTYVFMLKNVANPNRTPNCGLAKLTTDYVVQNEIAERIKQSQVVNGADFGLLKLVDLNVNYKNIKVTAQVKRNLEHPEESVLTSLTIESSSSAKFVVRSNTVQITGQSGTDTKTEYTDFNYLQVNA